MTTHELKIDLNPTAPAPYPYADDHPDYNFQDEVSNVAQRLMWMLPPPRGTVHSLDDVMEALFCCWEYNPWQSDNHAIILDAGSKLAWWIGKRKGDRDARWYWPHSIPTWLRSNAWLYDWKLDGLKSG